MLFRSYISQPLAELEVAEKLDIVWQTYQHYESLSETNVRVPNLETVDKLSKILDCDITYLTGENKEEFKRVTQHAAETTGLQYETIEILEQIKNSKKFDSHNYLHKCILFMLDFLYFLRWLTKLNQKKATDTLGSLFSYNFYFYNNIATNPCI